MADDRYVSIVIPRCPKCNSANLLTYKSGEPEGDGSRSRYTRCRACGWRFIVIVENYSEALTKVWANDHTHHGG